MCLMHKKMLVKNTIWDTMKDIASKLDWIDYKYSIDKEIIEKCKNMWICIVTWNSDGIMLIQWYIEDKAYWSYRIGDWGNTLVNNCCNTCPYFKEKILNSICIEWHLDYERNIKINIGHYKFRIMRNWQLRCNAILFYAK